MPRKRSFIGMSVKVDPEMRTALIRTAKKRGVTAGAIIRKALANELGVPLAPCATCGETHGLKGRHGAQAA
jgi:predicted transcriptional regulator